MQSIVNEAMRVEGYCRHVFRPKTPEILYGLDPRQLPALALERASKTKDQLGRSIRSDAPLLLSGVISVPTDSDVDFKKFLSLSLTYLKRTYGKNLESVILHLDEVHPHLHYYAIPSVINDRFSMAEIHSGIKARNECKDQSYSKKANAYKKAMRQFQDDFYTQVGSKIGMTRLGPKIQRLTRKEWKAQQAQAEALSVELSKLRTQQRKYNQAKKSVEASERRIKQRETELTVIEKTSFFQNKDKRKNAYLRKRLAQAEELLAKSDQHTDSLEAKNSSFVQELKTIRKDNKSYQRRFEAMAHKLLLKDEYILKLKQQRRDNNYEKTNSTYATSHYGC
ncbi:plasmid recombination protein [Vibrio sp. SCSIO 43137]|uniref:plasmid recombination protein n=1 Tax=Vibrio sp. SCSIO 43137 TaxID=3021011 RepID=UPI0023081D18|nr:plasmid recombination protein [Vibrio sp. SCSIO 43137]WCE30063.1 plasmid recombination protein [Vibrio sp. SCSIO 43137]